MNFDPDRFVESGEVPRWHMESPIQIYIREDFPHLAGHTRDVSLEGLHIEIGVKLPLKSVISLDIYFQRDNVFDFIEQEPLKIKGKVMWRRPVSDENYDVWDTGLTFIDITPAQRQTIMEEVQSLESL